MRLFGGERVQNLMDTLGRRGGYAHREQNDFQHHREVQKKIEGATSASAKTCCS